MFLVTIDHEFKGEAKWIDLLSLLQPDNSASLCFIHQVATYIFIYLKDAIILKGTVTMFQIPLRSCLSILELLLQLLKL